MAYSESLDSFKTAINSLLQVRICSGKYRSGCGYHLYFGAANFCQFKDQQFYATVSSILHLSGIPRHLRVSGVSEHRPFHTVWDDGDCMAHSRPAFVEPKSARPMSWHEGQQCLKGGPGVGRYLHPLLIPQ